MSRTPIDIIVPDLSGKRAVVTGASDGIGLGIATRLAAAGAEVLLPVRNPRKGDAAIAAIRQTTPAANVSLRELDLSSLDSVAALGEALGQEGLDVTVVNCRFLKPYDQVTLAALLASHKRLLVVEEGAVGNGFGAYLARIVEGSDTGVRVVAHGVPDRIIVSASRARQLAAVGLDAAGIAERVRALRESEAIAG